MLYPVSAQIPFAAQFVSGGTGKTGLTVTVSVVRLNSDGTRTTVISAASATAAVEDDATNAPGLYSYLLAGASTATAGVYLATFTTTGTADLKTVVALEIVGAAWVATAAAPSTDILATPANKLATASDGSVALAPAQQLSQHNGTATAGSSTTLTLTAGASATDNLYRGNVLVIVSGTGANQARVIKGYVGSTKVATVGRAWAITPDNTSVYTVFALAAPLVNDLLEVEASSVQGNVTGSVANLTANNDKTGYSLTVAPTTAAAIDTQLTSTHGAGTWQQGNTVTPANSAILNAIAALPTPDNVGIAAIKAKTDNLPADPASNTEVDTRMATFTYIAPATPANVVTAENAILAAITDLPAGAQLTIVSPLLVGGDLHLVMGATYQTERGSAFTIPIADDVTNLMGATLTVLFNAGTLLTLSTGGGSPSLTLSSPIGTGRTITVELTSTQTTSGMGTTPPGVWYSWARFSDGDADAIPLGAGRLFLRNIAVS